jgi:hypothetical protein
MLVHHCWLIKQRELKICGYLASAENVQINLLRRRWENKMTEGQNVKVFAENRFE